MRLHPSAASIRRLGLALVMAALLTPSIARGAEGEMRIAQIQQPTKEAARMGVTGAGPAVMQPSKEEAMRAVQGGPAVGALAPGVSSCSLCLTCGGNWPEFSGVIPTRRNKMPYERGAACSGNLTPTNDNLPYLCCRGQ